MANTLNTPNASKLPLTVPDLVCVDDLDPGGAETESDLQTLAQDLYHILLEQPGSNIDDPTRGIGVYGLLGNTSLNLAAAANTIDSQFRKDPRVDSSKTTLSVDDTTNPPTYTIVTKVVPVGSVLPFTLGYAFSQSAGLVPTPVGG